VSGYEILEHTADVGVRARGATLEECFEQATLGLAEVMGIWRPGGGEEQPVELEAADLGALLVDWLSEVIYLHDSRDADLGGLRIHVEGGSLRGELRLVPRGEDVEEGTQVKAVTYHRLRVEQDEQGWVAQVYLDV
jgi:SHS2 domain-containing protein